MDLHPEVSYNVSESTKMTLSDLVKVKSLAEHISFLRLYFLNNSQSHLNQRKDDTQLDLIECVLAIFLFEISRVVKTGKHLFKREQFQYQVLHLFTNLRTCKLSDDKPPILEEAESQIGSQERGDDLRVTNDEAFSDSSSEEDSDAKLDDLIEQINSTGRPRYNGLNKCPSCLKNPTQSKAFISIYKNLVDDILKF